MPEIDWYTAGWIMWIAGFIVLEGKALRDKDKQDTLSEHVWRWFHVKRDKPTAWTWIGRVLLLTGGVWLTGHLAFGWWSF